MEWDLHKGKPQCEGCASNFLDDQPYQCLLVMGTEPLIRKDYCQLCWQRDIASTLSQRKEYAAWTGRYKMVVAEPKEEIIKQDHAQALFRKMLASGDPSKRHMIFVLAVLLERKKILKQQKILRPDDSTGGGAQKRLLVYSLKETNESIVIEDPQIRLSEWANLEKEVRDLLAQELAPIKS